MKKFADGIGIKSAAPATTPATTPTPDVTAKKHTGGKVAGQVSQTPNAIRKREQRAAAKQANQAGAGAFNQMATQLQQPAKTSTPDYSQLGKGAFPGYGKATYNVPTGGLPATNTVMPSNMVGSKPPAKPQTKPAPAVAESKNFKRNRV